MVGGLLDLVGDGEGDVVAGDLRDAVLVAQEDVTTDAVVAAGGAGGVLAEVLGGADEEPVEAVVGVRAEVVEGSGEFEGFGLGDRV